MIYRMKVMMSTTRLMMMTMMMNPRETHLRLMPRWYIYYALTDLAADLAFSISHHVAS